MILSTVTLITEAPPSLEFGNTYYFYNIIFNVKCAQFGVSTAFTQMFLTLNC